MSPVLRGLAAAPGVAAGPVVVLETNGDFASVVPGSVVVARLLSPRHAPLFARAAGVVVEEGGLLQHATALAREFAIPAVVGVAGATRELRPGQWVRVDGASGEVVLSSGDERSSDENERLEAAERNLFALYGLKPEIVSFDLPTIGIRTRAFVAGDGPPVLLLHGGSGSAAQWAPLMASLDRRLTLTQAVRELRQTAPGDATDQRLLLQLARELSGPHDFLALGPEGELTKVDPETTTLGDISVPREVRTSRGIETTLVAGCEIQSYAPVGSSR